MKKQHASLMWGRFQNVSTWFLLLAFIVLAVVSVLSLRQNNLRAIELREKVTEADKNQGDVETALKELRQHVHSHMNADLSAGGGVQQPVQLVHRYERLVAKEEARVEKANEAVYTKAQAHCERQNSSSFSGGSRVGCIEAYVLNNGERPEPIPDNLYKFDFLSPRWSPDLAGWSLVLAGLFLVALIVRLVLDRLIKAEFQD